MIASAASQSVMKTPPFSRKVAKRLFQAGEDLSLERFVVVVVLLLELLGTVLLGLVRRIWTQARRCGSGS